MNSKWWTAYMSARYAAVGLPLQEAEKEAEQRATRTLQTCLGLQDAEATYYARRCVLFRREVVLHDALNLDAPANIIAELLDSVTVFGEQSFREIDPERGIILTSLHYGLYSSMLVWWLTRAAVRRGFKRLTILFRSTASGQYLLAERRLAELEAVGIWSPEHVTLLDRDAVNRMRVIVLELHRALGRGEAILILFDASLQPHCGRDSLIVNIGNRAMSFARGTMWLARNSPSVVVPLYIRPHADSNYAVVIEPPVYPGSQMTSSEVVRKAIQGLVNQTIMTDPSPWEGWLRPSIADLVART